MTPMYEYYCQKCDARFEQIVEIQGRHKVNCPDCGNKARLLMSLSIWKSHNPFTKDGEGFTSVLINKQEAKERARANAGKYD